MFDCRNLLLLGQKNVTFFRVKARSFTLEKHAGWNKYFELSTNPSLFAFHRTPTRRKGFLWYLLQKRVNWRVLEETLMAKFYGVKVSRSTNNFAWISTVKNNVHGQYNKNIEFPHKSSYKVRNDKLISEIL